MTITTKKKKEIDRRRTFAIISHPDAGKTTITEKLLLLGGAIQMAGTVKARKASRHATSDWMELEKQRGISVTTSVMRFQFKEKEVNLLDTPGHQDFSEDTYRTLTAVDSAMMLIDSAKGVETQTIKLMEVCRMRKTPIVTFINKLDREGMEPLELLENIEKILNIECVALSWPIGMGKGFRGVYDIVNRMIHLFDPRQNKGSGGILEIDDLDDGRLDDLIGKTAADLLREDLDLVINAGPEFDLEKFQAGEQTPVFFGSALSGFGVEEMFRNFVDITPSPQPSRARERMVSPYENSCTGFVFKIQANMDPKHRDRIAFMRICSGNFKRGQKLRNTRLKRDIKISNPIVFMAQDRAIIEEAYAGDILGIHDTGLIEIGDSFSSGEKLHFVGIPSFAPEIFRRVILEDPLGMKKLVKGLQQLAQEGAVQLFKPLYGSEYIVGVVGQLQLEVLRHRLQNEYNVNGRYEAIPFSTARWYKCEDEDARIKFEQTMARAIARDVRDRPVFLSESSWRLRYTKEKHPKVTFFETSDGLYAE